MRELLAEPAALARVVDDVSWGRATDLPPAARAVLSRVMIAPAPGTSDDALVVRRLVVSR